MGFSSALLFAATREPGLRSGPYRISVSTRIDDASGAIPPGTVFTAERSVRVAGPAYVLPPGDIAAVFPPDNGAGAFADTFPQVVLTESTRPWQRSAGPAGAPWLALLVFTREEAPEPTTISVQQWAGLHSIPPPDPELVPDQVAILTVDAGLLRRIVPTLADLSLLCHVRAAADPGAQSTLPVAVVVGNRMPPRGHHCVAHLVSVEGLYDGDGFIFPEGQEAISLVTLKHWSFAGDGDAGFEQALEAVSRNIDTLRLPPPGGGSAQAIELVNAGAAPLPHRLRDASRTVSVYHGPLRPAASAVTLPLPARYADELLLYDPGLGLFDASYAAAWTLGRLLALQDTQFSGQVTAYKQRLLQVRRAREQNGLARHLPLRGESLRAVTRTESECELPPAVRTWILEKTQLTDIPFRYLVPDERMLPIESIRFFTADGAWIRCLLDGAFSVGDLAERLPAPPVELAPTITGFLLRSSVVSDYPNLEITTTGAGRTIRAARLSGNVLIGLCEGTLGSVTLRRAALTLNFAAPGDSRSLRKPDGADAGVRVEVPFRGDSAARVVDVAALAARIGAALESPPPDASGLAFQMIDASGGVSFTVAPAGA